MATSPRYATRIGRQRLYDSAATQALKPQAPGSRTLILTTALTDPTVRVDSGLPGRGSVSLATYNSFGGQAQFALSSDGDYVTLTWGAVAGATEYVVERSDGPGRQYVPVHALTIPSTQLSFLDGEVEDGASVTYKLSAFIAGVQVSQGSVLAFTQPARAWGGQLVITTGGNHTVNARYTTGGQQTGAVVVNTTDPVTLTGRLASASHGIHGFGRNVTVRNLRAWAIHPGAAGNIPGKLVNAEDAIHLDVQNCFSHGFLTTEFKNYQGNHTAANTFIFKYNKTRNVRGMKSDGAGGWQAGTDPTTDDGSFYRGQTALFNGATGMVGVDIGWNWTHNEPGQSRVEDNINTFKSSGTAGSPILIHDNYINGAFPYNVAAGTYYTGGGIIAGDVNSGYVQILGNIVVATTNYGVAVVGGNDNIARNNTVVRSPFTWNGTRIGKDGNGNVGISFYNYNNASAAVFKNNLVELNTVNWQYRDASNALTTSTAYTPATGLSGANNVYQTTTVALPVLFADEYATFKLFRDKAAAAGIAKIGA